MAYQLRDRRFTRVGVVGAGIIGPGVALHLAEFLGVHDVAVVVIDTSERALAGAKQRIRLTLDQRVAAGSLTSDKAQQIERSISLTTIRNQLEGASLVVEAISEDLPAKREVLGQIEQLIRNDAILLSTSAHFEPQELFSGLCRPRQAAVARYVHPADRNPTVELVAGPDTSPVLMGFIELLYEQSGRAPIQVASRFGHALSPIADGLLLAACTMVERGWASVDQVDATFRAVLGHPTGIFEEFDSSGGTRGAAVGLSHYGMRVGPWYHLPELLRHKALSAEPWRQGASESADALHGPAARQVADYLLGAYFSLACEVLDAQLIDLSDLQEALELGLGMRSAFALMNERGPVNALRLVEQFTAANPGMPVSTRLRQMAAADQVWPVSRVRAYVEDDVAVLTIRRAKQHNRIDTSLLVELEAWLRQLESDDQVRAVVVRGFGTEDFAAGAEVEELVTLRSPGQAMEWSRRGQRVTSLIDQMSKPVVAALNGRALGPGSEIAWACHARVGVRGLDTLLAQPEPWLGMIPAYGATQRLPRLIGLARAWPLLRAGEPISSANAVELGLLSDCVPAGDLTDRAVELAGQIVSGKVEAKRLCCGPIDVPQTLPEVDISKLSRPVDELLQQAMLKGAQATLQEGLEIETRLFGECAQTEDFQRGVANHINNGPDATAEFVHR